MIKHISELLDTVDGMDIGDQREYETQYRKGFQHGVYAMADGIEAAATEYDFNKFISAVDEWRWEGSASMIPPPDLVVTGKKINKETPLLNKPVHFLSYGKIERQGVIIGTDDNGDYFVQFYSWLTGFPTRIFIISKKDIEDSNIVKIYQNAEEWKKAYDRFLSAIRESHEQLKPMEEERP